MTERWRVLVVDDDPAVLRLVRVAFQYSGVEVITASNGRDALNQMEVREPDAVVLDLEMPVMDGRTFYSEIRSRRNTPPVMILSAFDAGRACRELGADAFMVKPFDPDTLVTSVVQLITGAEQ